MPVLKNRRKERAILKREESNEVGIMAKLSGTALRESIQKDCASESAQEYQRPGGSLEIMLVQD